MLFCFAAQASDRQNQSCDGGLRLLHLPPRPLLRPSSILLFQVGIRSGFFDNREHGRSPLLLFHSGICASILGRLSFHDTALKGGDKLYELWLTTGCRILSKTFCGKGDDDMKV